MSNNKNVSRRDFIKIVGLSGSGLFLAAYVPSNFYSKSNDDEPKIFSPNAFLRIDSNGVVTVIVPKSEMGQGVKTALPMLVAEELEVDWNKINIEQADADPKYGNQSTGGSTSVRTTWKPLRTAGATARVMLITAAAQIWNVSTSNCKAENGFVINKINNKKLSYGELVETASKLPIPQNVELKNPKDFKIIGKSIPRVDIPEKVYGTAIFGIDIIVPEMLFATVIHCPTFGGKLKKFDDTKAKNINGVKNIFEISSGVAVVADSTWKAFQGLDALMIDWDYGPNYNISTETIRKNLLESLNSDGESMHSKGNINRTPQSDEKTIEAIYEVPFLAHATMEPQNCVASVMGNKAELWAPTQSPQVLKTNVAQALGFKEDDVVVHVTLMGGGFGRRHLPDFGIEAAEISKAIGKPVKLTWTRSEDMKHSPYRPPSVHKLVSSISRDGKPVSFSHHIIAPSIREQMINKKINPAESDIGQGTELEYNIPNVKTTGTIIQTHIPITWWRSVYHSQNPFAIESFIDEMAVSANKDPYEFRRDLLPQNSRLRKVLELVAEKSDWYKNLGKNRGRGISAFVGYDSYCAEVVEVTILDKGNYKVDRVICAVDCGIVVNPDGAKSQIEGGIAFALAAALKGEITIKNGGIAESNFDDYSILTYDEMPDIEIHFAENYDTIGGLGELAVPGCAPALCNAIYNATGQRIRRLPIKLS
ncbi:MAG: xanthine dehydrogenase family protein molybdopterin-binding subunit [Ignavibacteriaceae bacterium]